MSDTTEDPEFWGRQLLNKSQTNPLRQRMTEFIAEHEPSDDFKQLRKIVADDTSVSELVDEDREDRV